MLPVKKKYCFAKELRVCAPVLEVPTTVDPNPEVKSMRYNEVPNLGLGPKSMRYNEVPNLGLGPKWDQSPNLVPKKSQFCMQVPNF